MLVNMNLNNYWSNEGVYCAGELLDEFSPKDWRELESILVSRDDLWKILCVQSFSKTESLGFEAILLDLIYRNHCFASGELFYECLYLLDDLLSSDIDWTYMLSSYYAVLSNLADSNVAATTLARVLLDHLRSRGEESDSFPRNSSNQQV